MDQEIGPYGLFCYSKLICNVQSTLFFFQILDRFGEWRECGRYAGTMQKGEEINIPCPPYDCKFSFFPLGLEASYVTHLNSQCF